MFDNNNKYHKLVDGQFIKVNPTDYRVSFYCSNIHWINIVTGKEEDIYIDDNTFNFKKDTMEIETKLLVIKQNSDEENWENFTFFLKDLIGFYAVSKSTTRLILPIGEFEVLMPYEQIKKLKKIDFYHSSLLQFN